MERKEMDVELIDISKVYESLRNSEYSVENGIGELADNSVEAKTRNICINVTSKQRKIEGKKKPINGVDAIYVADDGCGMDKLTLWQSLVLGKTMRSTATGKNGIGKYGVGMTLGSISLGRKVEVYSRNDINSSFLYTYIDLDEISEDNGKKKRIPIPIVKDIPKIYSKFFDNKTGTLVIISNCDRIIEDVTEVNASIAIYLGRTYRKFIEAGLNIEFNGAKVYLHDPLYYSGPTRFDLDKDLGPDPKASIYNKAKIKLDIPGEEGKTAIIDVTLSILPREWRLVKGSGGSSENRLRKVEQNEGVSILRANREVFYGKIPYLIGKKGQANYEEKDRFWGCEISFPPELDDYFQVRYIKRGIEPIASVKDKLRDIITPAVLELRKIISNEWYQNDFIESKQAGIFGFVEQAVEKAEMLMPASNKNINMTEKDEDNVIDIILKSMISNKNTDKEIQLERQERKKQIKEKQITLNPVNYPASVLFEPKFLMDGKMVININVNHPFYKKFIVPLCGNLENEDMQLSQNMIMMRDAVFLIFCSYARANSMFDEQMSEELLEQHLSQMGVFLGAMTREYM